MAVSMLLCFLSFSDFLLAFIQVLTLFSRVTLTWLWMPSLLYAEFTAQRSFDDGVEIDSWFDCPMPSIQVLIDKFESFSISICCSHYQIHLRCIPKQIGNIVRCGAGLHQLLHLFQTTHYNLPCYIKYRVIVEALFYGALDLATEHIKRGDVYKLQQQ